jgi:ESCRT-II complex subunit VPS25
MCSVQVLFHPLHLNLHKRTHEARDMSAAAAELQPANGYVFPPHYSFPPFFTRQPNPLTRSSQFASWSSHILSYCRHHHIFSLTPVDAVSMPLFSNAALGRSLSLQDAREILSWMASEAGGQRIEWVGAAKGKTSERCWVYWRRPEEWAGLIEAWVEGTGQKGTVLTLYELAEGDATRSQGMMSGHWSGQN